MNNRSIKRNLKILCLLASFFLLFFLYKRIAVSKPKFDEPNDVVAVDPNPPRLVNTVEMVPTKHLEPKEYAIVPDIVHYVWIGDGDFKLHHLLSVRSADRYLNPRKITFHVQTKDLKNFGHNFSPKGRKMWLQVERLPNFSLRRLNIASGIYKTRVEDPRFQSLYARLKILRAFGGIALDQDVICLKPFDQLLRYEFVIGREADGQLNPSIILANQESVFLSALVEAIHEYNGDVEDQLWRLAVQMSEQLHVENRGFRRHDYGQQKSLFYDQVDQLLEENYALKLYQRKEFTIEDLKSLDSTFGRMVRTILFGLSDVQMTDWQVTTQNTEYVVPNIVHYFWFTCQEEFMFHHFLGLKSVVHNQKPDRIFFYTDCEPSGALWKEIKGLAGPMLDIVSTPIPKYIFGKEIQQVTHASDMAGVQALIDYGGIYLNSDAVILKSLDPLRVHNCTMGLEISGLSAGISLSARNSTFMQTFKQSLQFYDTSQGNLSAVFYRLAAAHPDLVHIESTGLTRPHWTDWWDMLRIWRQDGKMDWSHIYGLQWVYHYHKKEYDPLQIRCIDSNFGEIARQIYYGSMELMECKE